MEALETPPVAAPASPGGPEAGGPVGNGQPDLRGLAAAVAARHNLPGVDPATGRRPRGRPRKDGLPAGSVPRPPDAGPVAPVEAPDDGGRPYVVDPGLVERLAKAAISGIEAWEQTQLFVRARVIFADDAAARALAAKAGPPPGCVDVMATALAEITQKYDLASQWTPEIALTVAVLTWAGKDVLIFGDLAKRAAQMPKAPEPAKP